MIEALLFPEGAKSFLFFRVLGIFFGGIYMSANYGSSTLVMIMAGGQGSRLQPLTADRAKPAVHFAGKSSPTIEIPWHISLRQSEKTKEWIRGVAPPGQHELKWL